MSLRARLSNDSVPYSQLNAVDLPPVDQIVSPWSGVARRGHRALQHGPEWLVAKAGRLTVGSSLKGAMVSRVKTPGALDGPLVKHVVRAMVVTEPEAGGHVSADGAEVLAYALAHRLHGLEAAGALVGVDADAFAVAVINGDEDMGHALLRKLLGAVFAVVRDRKPFVPRLGPAAA